MAKWKSAKEYVWAIYETIIEFCEDENHYAFPVDQVIRRVAVLTGKSEKTIKHIESNLFKSLEDQP